MDWEKEFDEKFGEVEIATGAHPLYVRDLKNFISCALQSQMSDLRKEVEKVKGRWNGNGEYYHNVTEALDEVLLLMKR